MGRHSRHRGDPPTTLAGRGKVTPPDQVEPIASDTAAGEPDATPADATPADASPADAAPALGQNAGPPRDSGSNRAQYASTLDDTGRIPLMDTGSDASIRSATPPISQGNVLTRPADPTQVIPRIRPDGPPPRMVDPDNTVTIDRTDATTEPADHPRRRRHPWVWVGVAVFWLLALGAGLITLASLGAPHYLCTGTASTGLACERTGTGLAAVLTVVLVGVVGSVSVLAIEQRARGRAAWRWLGIGVIVLVVVASFGYLLIRTIGG